LWERWLFFGFGTTTGENSAKQISYENFFDIFQQCWGSDNSRGNHHVWL
jgi:hypothetical protein